MPSIARTWLEGLLIPDPAITVDAVDSSLSSYTQAGYEPGAPIPDQVSLMSLRSGFSGRVTDPQQTVGLKLGTGGMPGRAAAFATLAGSQYGMGGPADLRSVIPINGANGGQAQVCLVCLDDRRTMILSRYLTGQVFSRVMDHSAQTLTNTTSLGLIGAEAIAAVGLGGGRALLLVVYDTGVTSLRQVKTYYTTDTGATWTLQATETLPSGIVSTGNVFRIAASLQPDGGAISIVIETIDNSATENYNTLLQYASDDEGFSFTLIDTWEDTDYAPARCSMTVSSHGIHLIGVFSNNSSVSEMCCCTVGSAFEAFRDAGLVELGTTSDYATLSTSGPAWWISDGETGAACDETDHLVAYGRRIDDDNAITALESFDLGSTWANVTGHGGAYERVLHHAEGTTQDDSFMGMCALAQGGRWLVAGIVERGAGAGGMHQRAVMLEAGGWGRVRRSNHDFTAIMWGAPPSGVGYTVALGGSAVADYDSGDSFVNFVAASGEYGRLTLSYGGASDMNEMEVEIRVNSGGSTTSPEVGFRLEAIRSGSKAQVTVAMSSTGVRVYDEMAGAWLAAATALDLTKWTRFHASICYPTSGDARLVLSYQTLEGTSTLAQRGELESLQELMATDLTVDTGSASSFAAGAIGVLGTGTLTGDADVDVRMALVDIDATDLADTEAVHEDEGGLGDLPRDPAVMYLGGRFFPFGVYLAAVDGPGRVGETWQIPAAHRYALANLHAADPDSGSRWRSTQDADDEVIVWDLIGYNAERNAPRPLFGLMFHETNFDQVDVALGDGAGSFTTIGAIRSSDIYGALNLIRNGDIINPGITTPMDERYIHDDQLAGSRVILGNGSSTPVRRILENNGGVWDLGNTTYARLRIDGHLSGDPTNTLVGRIWPKSWAWLFRFDPADDTFHRYVKVTIKGSTSRGVTASAEGYFEAGGIWPGWFYPFAHRASYGDSETHSALQDITSTPDGYDVVTSHSDALRQDLELSWTEGMPEDELYGCGTLEVDPTYQTFATATSGVATDQALSSDLVGILSRCRGAELPVVVVRQWNANEKSFVAPGPYEIMPARITSPVRRERVNGRGVGGVVNVARVNFRRVM